jgi:UDP-N-acetylglucosamine 4,6-dehydratase/5-epimerase
MEKLLIQGNAYVNKGRPRISCVRYGNVAGSRGSIIPLFLEQKKTGFVTVTHKDMIRFWLTMKQAIEFVIKAVETMEGGEVFIPKMPSFRIMDLVQAAAPDVKIKYIGVRPGEKLHEDMITVHECHKVMEHDKYYVLMPELNYAHKTEPVKGKKVPENFSYSSKINGHFLSIKQLQQLVTDGEFYP